MAIMAMNVRAFRMPVELFCLLGLCLSISACASTKVCKIERTGNFKIEADEARMWKRAEELQEVLNKSGYIYHDDKLTEYVNDVLHKLIGDYEKNNNVKLRVYIIKDPYFNAFCLPNGAIYIHSSILANADNEAQLATLLGHEATHFLHRHLLIEKRSLINKSAFISVWDVTLASAAGAVGVYGDAASLARLLGDYCVLGSIFGYSRELERDADRNAFELVKKAGYPYSETKKFMENLYEATKDEKKKPPYFYSSHPETRERIKTYQHLIMELSKDGEEKVLPNVGYGDLLYNKMTKNVLLDNIELELKRNNMKVAKKQIEKYNKLSPNNSRAYCLLGQACIMEDDKEGAEKALMASIGFEPSYAESHKFLGLLYYKKEEKEKARVEFETYLRLKPNAKDAEYIRGYLNE